MDNVKVFHKWILRVGKLEFVFTQNFKVKKWSYLYSTYSLNTISHSNIFLWLWSLASCSANIEYQSWESFTSICKRVSLNQDYKGVMMWYYISLLYKVLLQFLVCNRPLCSINYIRKEKRDQIKEPYWLC